MKTPSKQSLPKGAHSAGVPGTAASRAMQGAPRPKPVTIDERFVSNPKGGKPLVVGKGHIEVKDNRTKTTR